jgi:anti-sigma B factor antagonist
MSMTAEHTVLNNKSLVSVTGEVDVSNADELRCALSEAAHAGTGAVEVDLSNVSYIDSTGIGVLVGAAHRAADANVDFAVLHPQRNVERVLAMLGVSEELGVRA